MMINRFFDEEASEGSDNEGEVTGRQYTQEEIARENMDETTLEAIQRQDRRRREQDETWRDLSVEEIARGIEQRHQRQLGQPTHQATLLRDEIFGVPAAVGAAIFDTDQVQPNAPTLAYATSASATAADNKVWVVACSKGKAPRFVDQIRHNCPVVSVASRRTDKNHIYIECWSERAALDAIRGIRGIFPSTLKRVMMPMHSILQNAGQSSRRPPATTNLGFFLGDTVQVSRGDLLGLQGRITCLDHSNGTDKMKPNTTTTTTTTTTTANRHHHHDADVGEVEVLAEYLVKVIPVGSRVKIMDGPHANHTGLVVAASPRNNNNPNDDEVIIFTDTTNKEVAVKLSNVQESAQVVDSSGLSSLEGFELHDLISLVSQTEAGVIVHVGEEDFSVMNQHGVVRDHVHPQDIRRGLNFLSKRGGHARDSQGNPLEIGSIVRVVDGRDEGGRRHHHRSRYHGSSGTIKRMYKTFLFLYSQTRSENAGIFVVRSQCALLAGINTQQKRGGSRQMTSRGLMTTSSHKRPSLRSSKQGGRHRDPMMGKSVRIRAGKYKGYLGTVCDVGPSPTIQLYVELLSMPKKVLVLRDGIVVAEDSVNKRSPQEFTVEESERPMTPPCFWDLDD